MKWIPVEHKVVIITVYRETSNIFRVYSKIILKKTIV